MSALSQTVRGLRNLWGHADDEDYAQDEVDTPTIKTTAPPNRSAITTAAAPATALTTTLNLNPRHTVAVRARTQHDVCARCRHLCARLVPRIFTR
jgi:hypothetical protein